MQKGKVYRSTGSWYDVKLDSGSFIKARIQGKFRNHSIKTTNPVSVGDEVDLLIDENNEGPNYSISRKYKDSIGEFFEWDTIYNLSYAWRLYQTH